MGSSSNKAKEEGDNEEIKNYDERDNFYSFYPKIKRKNGQKTENKEKEKDKSNENNSDNDDENKNSEENDDGNNKDEKDGDLNRNNSKNESENDKASYKNDKDDKNNSQKDSELGNNNKSKKSRGKIRNNKNKNNNDITESLPFNASSNNELDYYSKKLKSKNKANNDDDEIFDTNESKIMYDYKNLFTETGHKIPEYKVYAKNDKKKEKEKFWKKYKYNGIIIVEDLKDYFPDDISRDEIQELIFEAFGDCIVKDEDLFIPGQTATYDQVLELSDYVFNFIKGNDKKMKTNRALERLNIKIDLVTLDKYLIKDILFKGKDPSEKQLENTKKSLSGSSMETKVLTIEFL